MPLSWAACTARDNLFDENGGLERRQGIVDQSSRQRAAGAELQREVGQSVVGAKVIDLYDVGVTDGGDHLRLGEEAHAILGGGATAGQNHLQRDNAVEPGLPRPVHHAHAAAAHFFEQFIAGNGQSPGGRERVGRLGRGGRREGGLGIAQRRRPDRGESIVPYARGSSEVVDGGGQRGPQFRAVGTELRRRQLLAARVRFLQALGAVR